MAEREQRPNSGILFKQDKKEEKHADYSGTLDVDGKQHFINMWERTAKNGSKFFTVAVKRKGYGS